MATLEQWWKSFKIHAGFFKISIYLMSSKFIPSAELKKRQIKKKKKKYIYKFL